MGNNWFEFKQFRIEQQRSALKVGTDGVLLGAWCKVRGARGIGHGAGSLEHGVARILDVGTGTGVIALMLAQRSEATIDAIEINQEACSDAMLNFQNSSWKERLKLFKGDFVTLCLSCSDRYDLVVSNPPFFTKSLKSADTASSVARHDVSLSFSQLILGAKNVLTNKGRLAVIIPMDALDDFRETARLAGFYLGRKTTVVPRSGKPPKRVLLEFSLQAVYPIVDELVIFQEQNRYSEKFIELTKEFYLNLTQNKIS